MYIDRREQYKTLKLLGKGAFAEVYLVEDGKGRRFACKVCGNAGISQQEAACQRAVRHSLFPVLYDFWLEESSGYLLMEYVPGESLEALLRHRGRLPIRRAAQIGRLLAEGLEYLHRRHGLLFRDVKPANVAVTKEGSVKLLDFGCACPPGKIIDRAGTPGFGAPEQFVEGGELTAAADVYGLGRTLQSMAGGRAAGLFREIADKCTLEDPAQRLPDMREVGELLALCAGEGRAKPDARQRAILSGELRLIKDVCRTG